MGLLFVVGNVTDIFPTPLAGQIIDEIWIHTGQTFENYSKGSAYRSDNNFFALKGTDPIDWNFWLGLQEKIASVVGATRVSHLLSAREDYNVFLPCKTELKKLQVEEATITIASLPKLLEELELFNSQGGGHQWMLGGLRNLGAQIQSQAGAKFLHIETDQILDVYSALNHALISIRLRNQPLWVLNQP